jgi:hypothetical protein
MEPIHVFAIKSVGVGLTTPHSKKLIVTKVEQRKIWMDLTMMERVGDR